MPVPWYRALSSPRRPAASAAAARRRASSRRGRPAIELMEGRQLLTTMVIPVTSAGDNGDNSSPLANSLRAAIVQANKAPAATTVEIDFKLTNGGPQTISLVAPLPAITHQVFLNGTTEGGYVATPLVQLDGTNAGPGAIGLDFLAGAANSQVKGLEVNVFNSGGVLLDGVKNVTLSSDYVGVHTLSTGGALRYPVVHGNGTFGVELIHGASFNTLLNDVVSGNTYNGVVLSTGANNNTISNTRIGTDPTGTLPVQNNGVSFGNGVAGGGGSGVVINGGANNNLLFNDVISDNHDFGVYITDPGTNANTLEGCKVGTDVNGTQAFPNHYGVRIVNQAQGNVIGRAAQGNVISGNAWDAVQILGSGTTGNLVEYDFIGTNAAGTAALPNAASAVALAQGASSNTVAYNVLSGNLGDGVYMSDPYTNSNLILGNLIGVDKTGKVALGNALSGVFIINGPSNNVIGGTTSTARNVISNNGQDGVQIDYSNTTGNVVEGNDIGTDSTGTVAMGNHRDGVYLWSGTYLNVIGGTTPGARNVISGNAQNGVIIDAGSRSNLVEGNYIGTDSTGEKALGNRIDGVLIQAGSYLGVPHQAGDFQ
jgi:titin